MIQAICWVLVHSLWQGVLLALAGGGVILSTKRTAAAVRYRILCVLLGVFLGGMGLTFFYEWRMVSGSGGDSAGVVGSMYWLGDWCSAHAVQIVAVWLIVTVFKAIRMAAGRVYMQRMRREGLMAPALWVDRVDELSRQLGIRRTVKLVESALVRVPMVIGQLRPIIYIPLGLINHLPASEMEAVLLHELAHIRRYDHVVNMVQQVAECLLFFNPGFLWISSLLREERENCCDDIAIAHTRDRVEFVRALVRFKEHSLRGMALAFPGNKRQLLHRVLRISRQENKTLSGRERFVLLGGCLVLMCLLAAKVGRADIKKMEERVEAVGARPAGSRPVKAAPVELLSVLRTREQVVQNMEWVEAQLDRLHHRSGRKKRKKEVRNVEQAQANVEQTQASLEQTQASLEQIQAKTDPDDVNQIQEERNREQAEINSLQAERGREQAERDRQQAERDRQQVEKARKQAELERKQAELERAKGDMERRLSEQDQQKSKNN